MADRQRRAAAGTTRRHIRWTQGTVAPAFSTGHRAYGRVRAAQQKPHPIEPRGGEPLEPIARRWCHRKRPRRDMKRDLAIYDQRQVGRVEPRRMLAGRRALYDGHQHHCAVMRCNHHAVAGANAQRLA